MATNLTANDSIDTVELDIMARAERIAAALRADDYLARIWQGGANVRVYITRHLSRRDQQIGYVDAATGHVYCDRQAGHIEHVIKGL